MPISKLSRAATIDVLSDIPLLCEGVTGIGMFTVLLLVKKVCRMSIFLHGSSFLSFVAATLDLSRVIVGGDMNAFIIAREVLLLLAYPLLNLYLWELVAECPRSEANPLISKKKRIWHSASWDRWGLPGEALKWISLATLLTVPALQLVWRLIPAERQLSAIYIADSVLQTTLSFVFILKFVFNSYGPLSKPFRQAIRPNLAPILAISINLCLSVGNLPLFAFADTPLGRFLHAVGVYILLLYNLYSNIQDFVDSTLIYNKRRDEPFVSSPQSHRKENAWTTVLDQGIRRPPFRPKPPPLPYLTIPQGDIPRVMPAGSPSDKVDCPPRSLAENGQDRSSSLIVLSALRVPSPSSSAFDFYTTRASTPVIRPDSPILTSSVYVQGRQQVATDALDVPSTQVDLLESTALELMPRDSDGPVAPRSLSSPDQTFRHRDEVNKRIAALRELSPPCSVLYGGFSALDPPTDIAASTTPSNNSILSLSIFPEPPSNLMGLVDAVDSDMLRRKIFTEFGPISRSNILSPEMLQPCGLLRPGGPESMELDVTSFIRNLTMTDPTNARVMVASMYTESGVGPAFPRTYSQLVTSPILELCPAEGDELLDPVVE